MARPKTLNKIEKKQTCIYLRPKMRAWLAHQAAMENRSGSDIIEWLLGHYHKKCFSKDPDTPPID